ncbi:MAG: hypothetical protein KGZ25_01690 [Planctomycetes bacterium]|nr:hypothetical protein [Planctomycetota bacterium]
MEREDWFRVVEMKGPGPIPCRPVLSGATWNQHKEELQKVVDKYPDVFGGSSPRGKWENFDDRHSIETTIDSWGCRWDNAQAGIVGQVTEHPLEDWDDFNGFEPPDPEYKTDFGDKDWDSERKKIKEAKEQGQITAGGVSHGFLFQRLYYLRGFENLMMDIATGDPRLLKLIDMVVEFNMKIVKRYLSLGVDLMQFGDDLGMQERLTVSPEQWRRYIGPAYTKLFQTCRNAGAHVHLHSDGYITDIMEDLIEAGVTILNPQDLIHGLDVLKGKLKGKICIDLDIDRQKIIPWASPQEIDNHIKRYIKKLGSRQGGLMMVCGIYPPTPIENIEALIRAMSRYRTMYAE